VDVLPDYEGPAEYDVLLDDMVERHPRFPNGEPHKANLLRVERKWWDDVSARRQILSELGITHGLGDEWYADKNTYEADALKCYSRHGRPDQGCIDYECRDHPGQSKKRLGNPTKIGWQAGPKVFLCDFCPVSVWVRTQQRHAAGLYKEN
jgi:hypothetical protein